MLHIVHSSDSLGSFQASPGPWLREEMAAPSGDNLKNRKEWRRKEGIKKDILYNISMTNEGVASLITYNWRLPHDPQAPGRKGVNAVPVKHSSLSPPMHRFTWGGYRWDRSHPFSVKAGSPEIPVEGKPAHKSAVPGALHSPLLLAKQMMLLPGRLQRHCITISFGDLTHKRRHWHPSWQIWAEPRGVKPV